MIEGLKNVVGKLGRDRIYLGIDLTDEFSQISYCVAGEEPKTLSLVAGVDRLCIPTLLAKRYGESVWTYGEDAITMSDANEGFLVDRLLERARSGRAVEVESSDYDPGDLLALFLRKCLSRMTAVAPLEKVAAIVISVEEPDEQMVRILNQVVKTLRLKPERVFFQSHAESAYHYMLHQPMELHAQDVCVCNLTSAGLSVMMYAQNIQTRPHVMIMEELKYLEFLPEDFSAVRNPEVRKQKKDEQFRSILYTSLEGRRVSVVYLLGDGFEGDWCQESLRYICTGRRAFRGNNLFSKGACYSARERLEPSEAEKGIVFLGKDKLKANIGMKVMRSGTEAYMALLDAGRNWYDSIKECDLLLEREERLELIVTPLNGKNTRVIPVYLSSCPRRNRRAVRVHLELKMLSEVKAVVTVTDMGFGEFFAPSGQQWETEFRII
ncbi:MAG: hypothetical protein IJ600_08675 [Lachnospiraceae bacterium]|nr:hypothetical protein [Lachnospiraceae bacterium]